MSSPRQTLTRSPARCSSALANCLLGLLVLFSLAWGLQQLLGMSVVFFLASLAAYLVGATVLLASLPRRPALTCFGAANQVTLVRAILVALLFGLASEAATPAGAWLARRLGLSSAFGARFDMETDALLIVVLALLVWRFDKAGYWVLLAGLLRYLFIAAGGLLEWLRRPLTPSRRRQTVCVVQILTLVFCLLPPVVPPWSQAAAALGLLLLVWSFTLDVIWLARRARRNAEEATS